MYATYTHYKMKYLTQKQNDTLFNYLSLVYTVVMNLSLIHI